MRNLLDFLSKYSFFFLFLFLEVICFVLIYNNNYFQRSRIISTTNGLTGNANAAFHDISSYLFLKRTNQELADDNAFLRSHLQIGSDEGVDSLLSLPTTSEINYISAKVISHSVHKRNNYFMLNKGAEDGVKKDMGVITANGVVGIIIDVSRHFSSGISILHKDTKISGRIKKNLHLVNVSWNGINYRQGTLEDIPTHVDLNPGDTIITSGNSHIFPEGIMIGTVEEVHGSEQLFKSAGVRFSADYNQLYYVYIIENNFRDELKEISTERQ
jgi:rod shape-determining protein MreC